MQIILRYKMDSRCEILTAKLPEKALEIVNNARKKYRDREYDEGAVYAVILCREFLRNLGFRETYCKTRKDDGYDVAFDFGEIDEETFVNAFNLFLLEGSYNCLFQCLDPEEAWEVLRLIIEANLC